jgi:mRNA-degrading endonuclease toxin of MazEF toxin-antitoxin module
LPTQVSVNSAEGLKHESAIQCDGLMSLEKSRLTDCVGELASDKLLSLRGDMNGKNSYSHRKAKLERSPLILHGR